MFVQSGLTSIFGGIQYLEQVCQMHPEIASVLDGSNRKIIAELTRVEDRGILGEQAKEQPDKEDLQLVAAVPGFLQ